MAPKDDCMKGNWSNGLFDIKCPLCFFNYCCAPCSIAQISEKLGNPYFGSKPVACIVACLGFGAIQILLYGQKSGKEVSMPCGILKCWCCGICYLHQQYKEHGCVEAPGEIVMTSFKPSQVEMA